MAAKGKILVVEDDKALVELLVYHFEREDFMRLREQFGVSWVVLQQPGVSGLVCPYTNAVVTVCRIGL